MAEGAEVVESVDMVGVGVRIKDGMDPRDLIFEEELSEVRRGIDDEVALGGVDKDAGSSAVVVSVEGTADMAVTAEHGDAVTGAGAHEDDFDTGVICWVQKH